MPPRGVKKGTKRARQYEHVKKSVRQRGAPEDRADRARRAGRRANPDRAPLLRLRLRLPRPAAGRALERTARGVVGEPARSTEDRSLERERGDHLRARYVAMLGLGRLLVVDQGP